MIEAATVGRGDLAVGIAVVQDGEVVHEAAFGTENPLFGSPATPATRFRLASVSKVVTTIVVMQLVEEGRIELDRPLVDQLPLFDSLIDPRASLITVRQLLSHTSGLQVGDNDFFGGGAATWQDAARRGLSRPLLFDPGTSFRYSNTNFVLLGLLIEHVTGQPYQIAAEERVVRPLGATGMRMAGTFDVGFGDAVHLSGFGRNYMEALGPAGGWIASPGDIARMIAALRPVEGGAEGEEGGRWHPLSADTVAEMRAPASPEPPAYDWTYGLGLRTFADGSWGHTGTVEQTRAIVLNRRDGTTIAVLVSGPVPWSTDDLLGIIDRAYAAL